MFIGRLQRKTKEVMLNDFDHFRVLCRSSSIHNNDIEHKKKKERLETWSDWWSRNKHTHTHNLLVFLIHCLQSTSKFNKQTMIRIGGFFLLSILITCIQSCTIIDILQTTNSTDVIFTGRILSFHQWSVDQPYSAFVWAFRILRGEPSLLKHYQTVQLQRPLYVIVDNLGICESNDRLKNYDVKIFGIRIHNARFYSSFTPLSVTVANLNAIEGKTKCYFIDFEYIFFSSID